MSTFRRWLRRRSPIPDQPVVICPFIHAHEEPETRRRFRLDEFAGSTIDFHLFHDTKRVGPERAFEICWDLYPARDVILIHSDMAPLPEDQGNEWYHDLIQKRSMLPEAGMIACNLFYPDEPGQAERRLQCGGGTFSGQEIGHLHGPTSKVDADLSKIREVPWVTFGGVLIRRDVINACGGFDRRYHWAYVMDVDYCFEARSLGFRLFQVPIGLMHEESRSALPILNSDPSLASEVLANHDRFRDKWYGTGMMPV